MSDLEVGFPSDDFPGPTPFRLRIPTDWRGVVVAGTELAVGAPTPVARFRPNVVVNVHRIARSDRPDVDLDVLVATDEALPGFEMVSDDVDPGPPLARRRLVLHDGPENVRLRACRLMVVVPVGTLATDVVSAVGTAAVEAGAAVHRVVDDVLGTLRVTIGG